jgi:lipopolysaccharide/colanic/teichoic acid biosynthesis glycosyltransferase
MNQANDIQSYIDRDVTVAFRHNIAYERRQRFFDLVIASAALVVTAPIMTAAAIAIWCEDRQSPFFTQKRVGQYGRLFTIYKLRTMRASACVDAISPQSGDDKRITRLGRLLRKTSIDELPQLFNVILGDMALVGPRPEMPFVVARYERWQHCRHLRKPGITGLWQISVRKQIAMHKPEATKIDLEYVRTASTETDRKIFIGTITALLHSHGAY